MNIYEVRKDDFVSFYIICKNDKIAKYIFIDTLSGSINDLDIDIDFPILDKKGKLLKFFENYGWTIKRCRGIYSNSKIQGIKLRLSDSKYSYRL